MLFVNVIVEVRLNIFGLMEYKADKLKAVGVTIWKLSGLMDNGTLLFFILIEE